MLENNCPCRRANPTPEPDWSRVWTWELKAQTFVEYRWEEGKGEEWIEDCAGSLYVPPPSGLRPHTRIEYIPGHGVVSSTVLVPGL